MQRAAYAPEKMKLHILKEEWVFIWGGKTER
jgi:hypothetical protein